MSLVTAVSHTEVMLTADDGPGISLDSLEISLSNSSMNSSRTTYRLSRSYYRLGLVSLFLYSAAFVFTAVAMWFEAKPDMKAFAVVFPSSLWLCFIAMSLWMIFLYRRSRIIIEGDILKIQGMWRSFSVRFNEIAQVRWNKRRSLQISTENSRRKLDFEALPRPHSGELIQTLRTRISSEVQLGWNEEWDSYAEKQLQPENGKRRKQTRRRLNRFTVGSGFIVGLVIGVFVQMSALEALPLTGYPILDWTIYGVFSGIGLAAMLAGVTWTTDPEDLTPTSVWSSTILSAKKKI